MSSILPKEKLPKQDRAPKRTSVKKEIQKTNIYYRLYKAERSKPEQAIPDDNSQNLNENKQQDPVADAKEEEFSRSVETTDKTRLKNLKQLILTDLKLQDMCAIRLYKDGEVLLGDQDLVKEL